jgi:tetratricopeptide (TPR) repeat protein
MCMNYNETSQWAADLGSGYSAIRPLGEGGMGTLYRAHKDSLDVDVVIKRVKQKFKGRMDERAEANILKTLKHKYLPRIYDVIESPSGYVYTIMDMIPGENMQNYVKTHGPVSQKLAYRWACQLCEVIAYLHSQVPPILHCDIKPSNIMITPADDICVIDFNTSLVFSKGVLAIGATPGYAAPEQYTRPGASPDTIETVPLEETMPLRGYKDAFAYQNVRSNKDPSGRGVSNSVTAAQATNAGGYGTISKRTDVYGIGATLYYAITGQQPGHSLKDVRPITSYKLKFSRSFLLIIARAMMKRQEERFCDAQEMLRALQDIHAIDGRYKKVVHSQRVVAAVSLVLAVSGTLAILFGVQRIGVERYAAYDALVRKGRTAADEMRFDEAEQDLQQAIAIYDDQLEAYVEQAVLLYRQGKYQECIDAVETTQSRELKYYSRQSVANLYNVAAEAYYELESYESAATMYQKAIGYSPDILSYYQGEATALIQLGDYSGADEVLAEMAKAVPDAEQSGAYQVVQSELLRKQGDLPDALDAARKAIGSADGNDQLARAYRLAASICEDIGDSMLSEEINLLNQGIEQLPDGYYNALAGQLASAYIRQAEATGNPGYQKDALRTYQQLEKNGNTTLEVRLNIAMLQYQLHDFSKAMEMLQALKKDYPKDYRVYKWLAFVQGELDLQNGASYTKTLGYYETAAELYRAEQASGVYDPQMDELDRMARNNWQ